MTRSGSWSASDRCFSSQRGDAQTPYYAKRFTFTLGVGAEVTIALSSSRDTYLYLLSGHGTAGTVRARNDDADSTTRDSRLSLDLAAGDYTIEATTQQARQAGSFTLTVAADTEGVAPVTVRRLAESYDATVGELFSAGFNYAPAAAQVSVQSVAPSGLSLTLADRSGSAGIAGTPRLAGLYKVTLAFAQPGRTDTEEFTVSASCAAGRVQQSDRSCEPQPTCTIALGRVSSGDLGPKAGSWEEGCALPGGRRGRSGVFYAKHYTFSLNLDAEVTIDLGSRDEDTYLFLLRGHGPNGALVGEDHDSGPGTDSRLSRVSLAAGDYTISASTQQPARAGDFTVALRAVAPASADLSHSLRVTVDERLLVGFNVTPAGIALPRLKQTQTPGLEAVVKVSDHVELDGESSLSVTADQAGEWKLTLLLEQPGRTDEHKITITATCADDHTRRPDRTCAPLASAPAALECRQDLSDQVAPYDTDCAWDAVSSPVTSQYQLQTRYRNGDTGWSLPTSLFRSATSATRSLTLGTYQTRVRATQPSAGAWSRWSEPFDVVVPTRPAAPAGDCAASTTGLESTVTWTWNSAGPQVEYDISDSDPSGHPAGQSLWQDVGRRTSQGPRTGLTPGSRYVIYVRGRNILGASIHTTIMCTTPAPDGTSQYAVVRKMAHLGNIAGGYTLQQFKEEKNPSDPSNPTTAPYPYLTWSDDDCSVPEWLAAPVLLITGWGNEYTPLTPGAPRAPLKEGCWRHDFAWRNLYRIEQKHGVDSWNQTNYILSNDRLKADWDHICSLTYTGVWSAIGIDCRLLSRGAWEVLNSQAPSVGEYSSNTNDVGYVAQD